MMLNQYRKTDHHNVLVCKGTKRSPYRPIIGETVRTIMLSHLIRCHSVSAGFSTLGNGSASGFFSQASIVAGSSVTVTDMLKASPMMINDEVQKREICLLSTKTLA